MKNILFNSNKVEVRPSSIHGLGVFATQDIQKGDTIEECPIILSSGLLMRCPNIKHYCYRWDTKVFTQVIAVALGYGSIYNCAEDGNAEVDKIKEPIPYIKFIAKKDIKKDEEITWRYTFHVTGAFKKKNAGLGLAQTNLNESNT